MPAQPLLAAATLRDQVVAVVDEQLQLAQRLLPGTRPVEQRLLQRRPRNRERVDPVGLTTHPAAPALRRGQPWRHPHQPLALTDQRLLEGARHMPAILDSPQPLHVGQSRPHQQAHIRPGRSRRRTRGRARRRRPPSASACVRPPRSRSFDSPPTRRRGDRRADRPQSRRKPRSYQVTLDGLGKATATQHWQVGETPTFGNRVSRRLPESQPHTRRHPPTMTLSSGMSLMRSLNGGSMSLRSLAVA